MRIGTTGSIDVIKTNIVRPANRLVQLYGELSSGKRINQPSDDPLATARVLRSQATLSELTSRQFVLQQGTQLLGAADSALGDITNGLNQCQQLALQSLGPGLGADQLASLAQQVRDVSASLVVSGNTEVQGQYIFAGSQTGTVPFATATDANLPVLYNGNHQQPSFFISASEQAPVGLTGAQVFNFPDATGKRPLAGVDEDTFSLLNDLANAIQSGATNQIQDLSTQLNKSQAYVVSLRGQVGVVTQRYQQASTNATNAQVQVKKLLSNDQDVDYASAMSDLSQQQTIYQAALSVTSKVLGMPDLFDLSW